LLGLFFVSDGIKLGYKTMGYLAHKGLFFAKA